MTAATSPIRLLRLEGFIPDEGFGYALRLPASFPWGDSMANPLASGLELFEDGRSLLPAHSQHVDIRQIGRGRFSHWHDTLYLSTSDNSDPRSNGRVYDVCLPAEAVSPREARLNDLVRQVASAADRWDAYRIAEEFFYEVVPEGFIGDYAKICWDDTAFVADYRRLVPNSNRSFERKYTVAQFVRAIKDVPGDLAECGVYNGATAFFMAQASQTSTLPRSLHLFDSFEGLSKPADADGDYWSSGDLAITEQAARDALKNFSNVVFYRGWIPQRFDEVSDRRFAFLHIDVDLYQPTLDSLEFFYPRLSRGGVIVSDDYGYTTCPGVTKAFQEFMRDKPEEILHLPTGQGVIIRS